MPREELQRSLEQLRAQIKKLDHDDEPVKTRMRSLVADLERQLDDAEAAPHPGTLVDGLGEHIEQFEIEHPRLTGVLPRGAGVFIGAAAGAIIWAIAIFLIL